MDRSFSESDSTMKEALRAVSCSRRVGWAKYFSAKESLTEAIEEKTLLGVRAEALRKRTLFLEGFLGVVAEIYDSETVREVFGQVLGPPEEASRLAGVAMYEDGRRLGLQMARVLVASETRDDNQMEDALAAKDPRSSVGGCRSCGRVCLDPRKEDRLKKGLCGTCYKREARRLKRKSEA